MLLLMLLTTVRALNVQVMMLLYSCAWYTIHIHHATAVHLYCCTRTHTLDRA